VILAERRLSALVVHLLAALSKVAADCPGERHYDDDRVDLHDDVDLLLAKRSGATTSEPDLMGIRGELRRQAATRIRRV
jgi:hypothetical protein